MKKIILFVLPVILNAVLYGAVSGPYTVDTYTKHLYHFDGNTNDAVSTGSINLSLINGATITDASYSGFGTALNTYDNVANSSTSPSAVAAENITVSNFIGSNGAFTFEAIVKPNVTLTQLLSLNTMEIISGEGDGTSDRGWQFRIDTTGRLEFNNLSVTSPSNDFFASLPTTGEHAYAAGSWYHVAVTYTGTPNVSGNLKMYWTKLDSSASIANQIGGPFTMTGDIASSRTVDFVIGCDGRSTGGYNENFEGWIDEARISSIARAADEMLITLDPSRPVIITSPSDTTVQEPQAAVFQAVFTSITTPTVQWFKVDLAGDIEMNPRDPNVAIEVAYDSGSQQYTTTLTISNTMALDTGQYYCHVSNESSYTCDSDSAELLVLGLVAHWTLDLDDFVSGRYLDTVSGYDANAVGTPMFVAGANGSANGAVQIDGENGWATVDEFDPGATGAMTVSVWVNWQETSVSSDDLVVTSLPDENSISVDNGLKAANQWQQVCAVFDGTTGKVYINGKLQAQGGCSLPDDMTSLLDIGSTDSGSESFNGYMDDLRIYNCVITNTEVADIYYAMTGHRVCILSYASDYDFSGPEGQKDCIVDLYDLVVFANNWLILYDYPDFADLSRNWLSSGLYPAGN